VLPPEDRETIEYRKHFNRVIASCLSNIAAAWPTIALCRESANAIPLLRTPSAEDFIPRQSYPSLKNLTQAGPFSFCKSEVWHGTANQGFRKMMGLTIDSATSLEICGASIFSSPPISMRAVTALTISAAATGFLKELYL
jgi:hypothetical protein